MGSGLALLLFGGALYLLHRQVAAYPRCPICNRAPVRTLAPMT
jgi:hypothetical protein